MTVDKHERTIITMNVCHTQREIERHSGKMITTCKIKTLKISGLENVYIYFVFLSFLFFFRLRLVY